MSVSFVLRRKVRIQESEYIAQNYADSKRWDRGTYSHLSANRTQPFQALHADAQLGKHFY